ncbi:hypothetical protein AV530_003707 [Patagioenas fasciata monilis]|uniref:Uncharacterized protein n=1 Tax=Patagioenas fasciata monilis TaxID=372326 RepID=A0A1V4KYC6_PATFA|nr:hypothetical protein AV530_003707 [Patagioenas fasciata monilis]
MKGIQYFTPMNVQEDSYRSGAQAVVPHELSRWLCHRPSPAPSMGVSSTGRTSGFQSDSQQNSMREPGGCLDAMLKKQRAVWRALQRGVRTRRRRTNASRSRARIRSSHLKNRKTPSTRKWTLIPV